MWCYFTSTWEFDLHLITEHYWNTAARRHVIEQFFFEEGKIAPEKVELYNVTWKSGELLGNATALGNGTQAIGLRGLGVGESAALSAARLGPPGARGPFRCFDETVRWESPVH